MSGEDHERRISTVEANFADLLRTTTEIKGYLGKFFSDTNDIKTALALLVNNQNNVSDYQKKCDHDRADHEKRITEVEGIQSRAMKMAAGISTTMAFIITAGLEWARK